MLQEARLKELLDKALAGKASDGELRELTDALHHDADLSVTQQITSFLDQRPADATYTPPAADNISAMADQILAADKTAPDAPVQHTPLNFFGLWKRIAVAAAFLAIVSVVIFYLTQTQPTSGATAPVVSADSKPTEIKAGSHKARLILADRSEVVLDTAANGIVSVQANMRVFKDADGKIAYSADRSAANYSRTNEIVFNTIAVPRGGFYQLSLADGTLVWLNASSSLRFPVSFTGTQRLVELEGEGYFEVAKDATKPFIVRTGQADVKVLGTHFNVSAYAGEAWKATLVEGSVEVKNNHDLALLKPGNQAIVNNGAHLFSMVADADLLEATAWKDGYFQFNEAPVTSIMQQVSRWYDVDIEYKDSLPTSHFNGRIDRDIPLSGVVNALKQGGIKCAVDRNRLVVYP
ncbi:FecR family protein [Paraflavitalea pollutisoli]|uniref:FecR family protein n=1 Tax=Paraflavitalea pollutisoli TaxID=3034143 RepID=UPI0023ED22F0|nr:FecR family protein [Paraflavitalea sp. H1-2-19X]